MASWNIWSYESPVLTLCLSVFPNTLSVYPPKLVVSGQLEHMGLRELSPNSLSSCLSVCLSAYLFVLNALSVCLSVAGSQWPVGTYGVARAQAGCPAATGFQWRVGWRYQDTEDAFPNNRKSPNFHLDASVSSSDLKRHFCTKTDTTTDTARPPWPAGETLKCVFIKRTHY